MKTNLHKKEYLTILIVIFSALIQIWFDIKKKKKIL